VCVLGWVHNDSLVTAQQTNAQYPGSTGGGRRWWVRPYALCRLLTVGNGFDTVHLWRIYGQGTVEEDVTFLPLPEQMMSGFLKAQMGEMLVRCDGSEPYLLGGGVDN
jgi:hypothetical protein